MKHGLIFLLLLGTAALSWSADLSATTITVEGSSPYSVYQPHFLSGIAVRPGIFTAPVPCRPRYPILPPVPRGRL